MPEDLRQGLLADVERYDRRSRSRSVLAPYRDILLLQRAKFMSYREIAEMLTRRGLRISANSVAVYCRRNLRRTEVEATRRGLGGGMSP